MSIQDLHTDVFIILDESNLDTVKTKSGMTLTFSTWAQANKTASVKMLEVWSVQQVKFNHKFIQHEPNFVEWVDFPLKPTKEISPELLAFLENADCCFQDTPGTVRFMEQVLASGSQKLALESIQREDLNHEIHTLRSRGALVTGLEGSWFHITLHVDVLDLIDREPAEV